MIHKSPLFFVLLLFSCVTKQENNLSADVNSIISTLINEFGKPMFLPPPPPEKKVSYYSDIELDSILGLNQRIGVYPYLYIERTKGNENIKLSQIDTLETKFNFQKKKTPIEISNLQTPKNFNITYIDTTLNKHEQYVNYDKQFFFSNLYLSEKKDVALVNISVKHSGLYECLLEKKNGNWYVKNYKMTYIY
jgi:hypothetical protein